MRLRIAGLSLLGLAATAAVTVGADVRPQAVPAPHRGPQQTLTFLPGHGPENAGLPVFTPPGLEARDLLAAAGPYWAKTIGSALDESGGLVRRTAASEFIFAGTFGDFIANTSDLWIIKLDSAGNRVWEKVYGGPGAEFGSITAATDGGYLLYAESYDDQYNVVAFTLAKLDASGNIAWQKKLLKDGNTTDVPDFAIPLSDGGFLLSGSEFSFTSFPPATVDLLIRVSSAGAITWQKQYTRPSTDSLSGSVQQLADGSLLHDGVKYVSPNFANTDAWFRKLTSTGTVVFDKYIGGPESDNLYSVMPANGGGFISSGTTKSWVQPGDTVGNIWIVKFDANFNIVMQKSFGDTGQEFGSLTPLADGYLLSGQTRAPAAPLAGGAAAAADAAGDAFVAKLDNNLNVVWAKTYNAGGAESAYASVDSSGGYLVSGTTDSNGRGTDILLAKLDANGNVTWARAYGGQDSESGYAFRIGSFPASAPGVQSLAPAVTDIVLAGTTRSFGAGGNDVLAALLDSNGLIAGCPLVQTVTLTATPWTIPVITTTATVTNNTPTATDTTSYSVTNGALSVSTRTSTLATPATRRPFSLSTAAANTTSGTAPLTVNFTGTAVNGTPPYTWEWDFGDGSPKSALQNPSHTYNDPGSYPVILKVTDAVAASDTDDHLTIDASGGCALFCFSNVPQAGTAGQSIDFFGGAESANCTGSPTYSWTFGDGSTAATQDPSHAYAAAGTFNWTLTVSQNGASCTQNGTVTITGGGGTTTTYWIPSIAHAPGAGTSKWRSNIGVVNRSGATANLTLVFVPYAAGSTVTRNHTLANNATVEWADVLVSLFGFADAANTKGTVKITSDREIVAMARTYNQAASGTFGQYYPALARRPGDLLLAGRRAAVAEEEHRLPRQRRLPEPRPRLLLRRGQAVQRRRRPGRLHPHAHRRRRQVHPGGRRLHQGRRRHPERRLRPRPAHHRRLQGVVLRLRRRRRHQRSHHRAAAAQPGGTVLDPLDRPRARRRHLEVALQHRGGQPLRRRPPTSRSSSSPTPPARPSPGTTPWPTTPPSSGPTCSSPCSASPTPPTPRAR